jgi:hypothetical protein
MIVKASSFEGTAAGTGNTPPSSGAIGRTHSGVAGSIEVTQQMARPFAPGVRLKQAKEM